MYMAKRVFKNKRLMRSLLILAGFLIVGFFLWTMLFKRSSVFEGQTTQTAHPVDAARTKCWNETKNIIDPITKTWDQAEHHSCIMNELDLEEGEYNGALAKMSNENPKDPVAELFDSKKARATPGKNIGATASPTARPTASPTARPTASPTARPTASPTAAPP
jgi:hypothetical protein